MSVCNYYIIIQLYGWVNWVSEGLSNLSKGKKLVIDKNEFQVIFSVSKSKAEVVKCDPFLPLA